MHVLRASIRRHGQLALVFFALTLCVKVMIPAGFMVSATSDRVLTVTVCSPAAEESAGMQLVIPGKQHGGHTSDSAKKDGNCAFSALGKVATGGADALLLALGFAFILVLGLAPARLLPLRQAAFLRPPLRGPPATA